MTPEIANAAMQFMMRVQLTGQEVPAFNSVMVALQEQAQLPASASGSTLGARSGAKKQQRVKQSEG